MNFRDLWEGRTGRLPYLAVLIVSSAVIAILLFIARKMALAAHAPGVDHELSRLRALLCILLLGIGFLIAGVPLVLFARRRMRELGLSGVWLLLFPIAPLQALFTFAATSTWYFIMAADHYFPRHNSAVLARIRVRRIACCASERKPP